MRSGSNAQTAAEHGIRMLEKKVDGLGGLICLSAQGEVGIAYNTPRMARAYIYQGMNKPFVAVD